jgi:hypothetical protein
MAIAMTLGLAIGLDPIASFPGGLLRQASRSPSCTLTATAVDTDVLKRGVATVDKVTDRQSAAKIRQRPRRQSLPIL